MNYKKFYEVFEKCARKIRPFIGYPTMIENIKDPHRHWGPPCPFFSMRRDAFIIIRKNGKAVEAGPETSKEFNVASEFWRDHCGLWRHDHCGLWREESKDFRRNVISILKMLREEEK